MLEIMLPWGLFTAAVGAASLYLALLPEVFARRRFGGVLGLEGRAWWLCLIAIAALFAWPFFAAVQIEWERKPTFITVLLMTLGSGLAGSALNFVVQTIAGSYAQNLSTQDDAPALMAFTRAFAAAVTVLLIGLTIAAYWTIQEHPQDCLSSSYC